MTFLHNTLPLLHFRWSNNPLLSQLIIVIDVDIFCIWQPLLSCIFHQVCASLPFSCFLGSFKLHFNLLAFSPCQRLSFAGDSSLSSVLSFVVCNVIRLGWERNGAFPSQLRLSTSLYMRGAFADRRGIRGDSSLVWWGCRAWVVLSCLYLVFKTIQITRRGRYSLPQLVKKLLRPVSDVSSSCWE